MNKASRGSLPVVIYHMINTETGAMKKDLLPGIVHDVPNDVEKALMAEPEVADRWNNLTPIQRNEWICWITIVKKAMTRAAHIHLLIEELKKEGKRQPCCWAGCPHRKPPWK